MTLADAAGRTIRYLRISVTDRCNYRCTYCMPERPAFMPRAALLTFEEIARIADVFATFGVQKFRVTGGEPTVRADLPALIAQLSRHGRTLAMTTNGHLLAELAPALRAAGLSSINVSLDTLDPDRFATVTRRGHVARVVDGIDAAVRAGLRVQLNAVLGATGADMAAEEIRALCEFAWVRGLAVRFIEHMPMSSGELFSLATFVSAATARAVVADAFGELRTMEGDAVRASDGPARRYRSPRGEVGFISAVTEHFCDSCNRVRLTASGQLHGCLGQDGGTDLRAPLRSGASDDDLRALIAGAVFAAKRGHDFAEFVQLGRGAPKTDMVSLGG